MRRLLLALLITSAAGSAFGELPQTGSSGVALDRGAVATTTTDGGHQAPGTPTSFNQASRHAPGSPYTSPGRFTDPGDRAAMLDILPSDPVEIALVARNLTVHHNLLPHLGVPREQWPQVRNVWPPRAADALTALSDRGPGDLLGHRKVTDRLRGGCMAESHLLATLLRHKRIPVRIRAGYFRDVYVNEDHVIAFWEKNAREKGIAAQLLEEDPERWREVNHEYTRAQVELNKRVEHWVAEYWDDAQQRWRLLDANTDFLKAMSDIEVSPHLPRPHFEYAHASWQRMRTSEEFNPDQYAEWPQDGRSHIRSQLLWDFYSLLNHDIAGHDQTLWPADGQAATPERTVFGFVKEKAYDDVSPEEIEELDALAELLASAPSVDDLLAFYRASEHLKIPTLEADGYGFLATNQVTYPETSGAGDPGPVAVDDG
jgi:hypothetical protein